MEVAAAANGEVYGHDHRVLAAGIAGLTVFFGPEWLDRRVLRTTRFLHPPVERATDEIKRQDRIVLLAEHWVNLQTVPGFQWCLGDIRTESLETGLAKLIG